MITHADTSLPPLTATQKAEELIKSQSRIPQTAGGDVTPERDLSSRIANMSEPSNISFHNVKNTEALLKNSGKNSTPLKRNQLPKFGQIIRDTMCYVRDAFPVVEKQIVDSLTQEDQKDCALRAFANCARFMLKQLTRKETLQLWQKLHSLFQLKLDVGPKGQLQVDPVNVTDI